MPNVERTESTVKTWKINIQPYAHQREAILKAIQYNSYALLAEPGTGKTPIAIELIARRNIPTLIICPLSIIESVWMEKIKEWHPGGHPVNLWKNKKKLLSCYQLKLDSNHIGIVNYEGAAKLPRWYLDQIKFLIADESSRLKDPNAKITRFLIGPITGRVPSLTDSIPHRLIMSGTPAPNSPMEYWSQMAMVNKLLLGDHYYRFRSEHFRSYGFGGYMWSIKSESKNWIMDQVKKQSYYITKKDCLDLPDQIFETKKFELDAGAKKAYREMYKTNVAIFKGVAVLGANELAKIMKLRQITSGFLIDSQGSAIPISDKKMDILKETLNELGNSQVIIWCQFHFEIEAIMELLGEKACSLYGDMTQGDKEKAIDDFISGAKQYLVSHPKSGGVGLTFVNCSYNIYYSMDYSYESFKQSQDRTYRIGQKNKVTYFFLLADATIDEIIYKALQKKESISEAMLQLINA